MSGVIDFISGFCFLAGSFLAITGGVGLLRFPDFYTRLHASSVMETLATPLIIIGLMLQTDLSLDTAKLLLIMVFILATNPTATHAMAKAALHGGQRPLLAADESPQAEEDRLSKP